MAAEFLNGATHLTLHEAITKGYITTRQTGSFKEILDPLNSYLRLDGIASYDTETKSFIYEKLKFITPEPEAEHLCHFTMSYQLIPEGTAKEDRIEYLNNFTKYRNDLCFSNLANLLSKDSVYNSFQYKDAPDKHGNIIQMNRSRDNVIGSTNIIILDIDKASIDINTLHDYLAEIPHLLATTADKTNLFKYRLLLPINVELSADAKQYSYVVKKLAAELLLDVDKVSFNLNHPYYGYKDSVILTNETGNLFDITKFLTDYAKGEDVKLDKPPVVYKTEKARKNNVNQILDNATKVFDYAINAPMGEGSISLARASLHMASESFTQSEYLMCINFIHDQWENKMGETRFKASIVDQYLSKMQPDK